jgi:hypothetical protein
VKRTHASTLLVFVVSGLVVGYLGEMAIVSAGYKALVPPLSLTVTLVGVGVLVVALAWPIRRAVKGTVKTRIDPFRAMRVAVLAKACSVSGALVFGMGIGISLFLLTRTVLPSTTTVWLAVGSAIGAALLMAGGLVAEYFCTLPPPDEAEEEGAAHA